MVRPQNKTQNSLLIPKILVICVCFIIMLHNIFISKCQVLHNKQIFFKKTSAGLWISFQSKETTLMLFWT